MSLGLSAAVFASSKEKDEKASQEKKKKDTDTVSKLLVNTDLSPGKIAEIAGTSIEFVHQANEKIQR